MGRELGILQDIIDAPPTDGLWDDGRTDQDQLGGLSYAELELAMQQENHELPIATTAEHDNVILYRRIRARSLHKMNPIPVFKK
jgi:NAD+ synthase